MVRGIRPGRIIADPIGNLHQEAWSSSHEPARTWPIDVMGGRQRGLVDPDLRRVILDTERVLIDEPTAPVTLRGDDHHLTYDENGYPYLPAFLDRRTT
jgi:hypothetical protein